MHRKIFFISTFILCACTSAAISPEPVYTPEEFTVLFLGDTSFYENSGRTRRLLQEKGFDHSVKNFKQILTDSEYAIANLESPITTLEESPYEEKKSYILWQSPVTASYLKSFGIDAVSLGNNHTMDYGIQGITETFDHLSKVGIKYFGAGNNSIEANSPLMLNLPLNDGLFKVAILGGYEYREKYKNKFDFYAEEDKGGLSKMDVIETANQIRALKEEDPERFVIVFPHWGYRYTWTNKYLNMQSSSFADAGADLIIGHGAHQLGEIRKIGNTWVIYSLGNFMFNSWSTYYQDTAVPYSLIAALHFKEVPGSNPDIYLRLYPIFTNNNLTNHNGRFVSDHEFDIVLNIILSKSIQTEFLKKEIKVNKDKYGNFFEIKIDNS